MSIYWGAAEVIMSAIELSLLFLFSYKFLGIDDRHKRQYVLSGFVVATVFISISTFIETFSMWRAGLSIAIFTILVLIFFQGSVILKIVHAMLFSMILVISDIVAAVIILLMGNSVSWHDFVALNEDRLLPYCIARIMTVIIFVIIFHCFKKERDFTHSKIWYLFIVLFAVILTIVIGLIDMSVSVGVQQADLTAMVAMIALIMLILYVSIYYLFNWVNEKFSKQAELSMLAYQSETIDKYLIQTEESNKIIKILSHDLKHNLISWKELAEEKNYQNVLSEILEYERVLKANQLIDVNNEIVNAIINQKNVLAKKNNILIEVDGVIYDDLKMTNMDLCSLFGNLIDNAIEANLKQFDCNSKKIVITLKRKNDFLLIDVKNTYGVAPVVENHAFVSQKKNRLNHGVGMISIKNTVANYDGVIENSYENGIFNTKILLKAYEKTS